MKLEFTRNLPKEEGFYWWTNFGEHTPTILEVKRDYSSGISGGQLWAQNEEFCFKVEKVRLKKEDKDPDQREDGYYHGEELWCRIPNPYLPGGKKQIEPSCY